MTTARCRIQWGADGARAAASRGDVVVIVDVLRFSSVVTSGVTHRASIYPCAWASDAAALAASVGAEVAERSGGSRYSLSPASFEGAEPGARVVLPSLNGSQCTVAAAGAPFVFAGSLLNASAVAERIADLLRDAPHGVTVVACGELTHTPGEEERLRFALEDYLGAGAILHRLPAELASPEARLAAAAFARVEPDLATVIARCESGRELGEMGRAEDVSFCARLNAFGVVPALSDGAYVAA